MNIDHEDVVPLSLHLDELRVRIVRVLIYFTLLFCVSWHYNREIYSLLLGPLLSNGRFSGLNFIIADITDRFWISFKVSALSAIVVGLPFYLGEIYFFVKPALGSAELRSFRRGLVGSPVFFFAGAYLWMRWLLPTTVAAFLTMGPREGVQDLLSMGSFLGFALWMGVVFGVLFQLPIVLIALIRARIVSVEILRKRRREALLVLAAVSALATPSPDAFTMLALWLPLVILFEGVIVFGRIIERNTARLPDVLSGQNV